MSTQQHELLVRGMSCQHCVKGVTRAIQEQDPQADVQIDLTSGRVLARTNLSKEAVARAISEEGYEVQAA